MPRTAAFKRFAALALLAWAPALRAATVAITISPLTNNHAIPVTVFGGNEDYGPGQSTVASPAHDTIPNAPYMRLGGNRLSSYNWENNADNAGADYGPNKSDLSMLYWVGATQDLLQAPALGVTARYDQWRALGKEVLATIQMMGWVAADNSGNITVNPPATAWKQVVPQKGAAFTLAPNRTDAYVYMDEYVNFLVNKYGPASAGGIKYYDLDNEPGAWDITHSVAHPAHTTYAEMLYKTTATAKGILAVDPSAQIIGPSSWGYSELQNLSGWSTGAATDSAANNATYTWYINYYLDKVRQESLAYGQRLVHYLDFHYYPEAKGTDGERIIYDSSAANEVSQACAIARMQAPRSLWDSSYIENSWLTNNGSGPAFQLLPRLQASIASYYPGTGLSISEYNYGASWDVSGGIAQADMFGVLARFQAMGNFWEINSANGEPYVRAAFNLWLNYDGANAKVGDIYADAATTDWTATSAYATRSSSDGSKLWVIVLNKNYSATQPISVALGLTGGQTATAVAAYRFDSAASTLYAASTHSFGANSITDTLPARSATVYVCTLSTPFTVPTPTRTPTYASPTVTPTFTPGPATQLFDDFEDGNTADNWGGSWAVYAGAASSLTLTVAGPGAPSSPLDCGQVVGSIGDFGGLTGTFSGSPRDLSGYVGIEFMVKGSGSYWWQVVTASITDGDHYGAAFTATGAWTKVTILFSGGLSQRGFGAAKALDLTQSQYFQWASSANGAFNLQIDDVRLLTYAGSPTSTPSRTVSASPTRSASPTVTLMASPSASPTSTSSASPTPTPSASSTASPSASVTASPSRSPSPSSSVTPAATLTLTPVATVSPSATAAVSASASPTVALGSPTASPSATATPTASATVSGTRTPWPSASVSPSGSPSASPAASPTVSASGSPTATPGASATVSPTAAGSPTASPTAPALTASPSATVAAATPTLSATVAASVTVAAATPTLSSTAALASPTSTGTVAAATPMLSSTAALASPTPTRTVAAATPTPSATASVATPTPTPAAGLATPSPTLTGAVPGPAGLQILQAAGAPNPDPRQLLLLLSAPADDVVLTLWTPALVRIGEQHSGSLARGWQRLALDPALWGAAPRGLVYAQLQAIQGPRRSAPRAPLRLFRLN